MGIRINLLSVEDGIDNVGFRRISSFVKSVNDDTGVYYYTTGNMRSIGKVLIGAKSKAATDEEIEEIAKVVSQCDIFGLSCMTQYSDVAKRVIAAVRRLNHSVYILWGGIHAIMQPDDAILYADAVCTGEGEFAFTHFLHAFKEGLGLSSVPGFWVRTPDGIAKNKNLPLMSLEDMDGLPRPIYQDGEFIFKKGKGFVPIERQDFVNYNGLSFNTVWSVGCPMKCIYCGNSVFAEYDKNYRKIRHSSPATLISELKHAISVHPHVSAIGFYDDSFMALPIKVIEEFCALYKKEIGLPFAVYGLIPNYVREDKLQILLDAGLNRVRVGIQSGSQRILDFYQRATPVTRIKTCFSILHKYSKYMIPSAYDIILDNPIETTEDTIATLDLIYNAPKPYTLNLYALRLIPNSRLAAAVAEHGIDIEGIDATILHLKPVLANVLLYVIATINLPYWIYRHYRDKCLPSHVPQEHYPRALFFFKLLFFAKRVYGHIRFMDLAVFTGQPVYILWKMGLVKFWNKFFVPRYTV